MNGYDIRVKLASQNDFDTKITERINGLLQASPSIGTSLVAPDLKAAPVDSRNGKYATIIFYRDSRLDDATNVRKLLERFQFNPDRCRRAQTGSPVNCREIGKALGRPLIRSFLKPL